MSLHCTTCPFVNNYSTISKKVKRFLSPTLVIFVPHFIPIVIELLGAPLAKIYRSIWITFGFHATYLWTTGPDACAPFIKEWFEGPEVPYDNTGKMG